MNTVATGVVQLDVELVTSANPPVVISNRDRKVPKGDRIKWKKKNSSDNFKFSCFHPQSSPFLNVDITDNKIECDFEPGDAPDGTEFPYTIMVESGGVEYTSDETEVSLPTGGRAVIRN